jgi:hypothetical protein
MIFSVPKSRLIDARQLLVSRVSLGNYWWDLLGPNVAEQLEQHLELKTILNDMDTPLRRIDRTIEQVQDTLEGKPTPLLTVLTLTLFVQHLNGRVSCSGSLLSHTKSTTSKLDRTFCPAPEPGCLLILCTGSGRMRALHLSCGYMVFQDLERVN